MKFLFVSNYINHHQLPFCCAMYDMLGEEFAFLQTEPMEEERIQMGWDAQVQAPFLRYYEKNPRLAMQWIEESEVVLFGGTEQEKLIAGRLRKRKPVVRYSERIYKEGQWKAVSPRGLVRKYLDHTRYRKQDVYMLCAGAYVPSDFHIVRAYPEKLLRWGYFPETKTYDIEELLQKKQPASILWAARFLDWKHPELPVLLAKTLKQKGYSFHMDMIGGGQMQAQVEAMIRRFGLEEQVTLRGFLSPEEVRKAMEQTAIFLCTSDRREGWGAVINEAMNSGCAVVADHMIGAVPFLIRHGENGLIYRDGNFSMLCKWTEKLLTDHMLRDRLGREAYTTIQERWNAKVAARRLVAFCIRMGFLRKEDVCNLADWTTFDFVGMEYFPGEGPCSQAPVIAQRKMFSVCVDTSPHRSI